MRACKMTGPGCLLPRYWKRPGKLPGIDATSMWGLLVSHSHQSRERIWSKWRCIEQQPFLARSCILTKKRPIKRRKDFMAFSIPLEYIA